MPHPGGQLSPERDGAHKEFLDHEAGDQCVDGAGWTHRFQVRSPLSCKLLFAQTHTRKQSSIRTEENKQTDVSKIELANKQTRLLTAHPPNSPPHPLTTHQRSAAHLTYSGIVIARHHTSVTCDAVW